MQRPNPALSVLLAFVLPAEFAAAQVGAFDTWRGYTTSKADQARFAYASVLADLDGDGDLDLATTHWPNLPRVTVAINAGKGVFAQPSVYTLKLASLGITAADIDGDGFTDLIASDTGVNWDGWELSLFRNRGNGTFHPEVRFPTGGGSFVGPIGLAAADFDGDGRADVAAANYGYLGQGTTVGLLRNDGAGGFLPPLTFNVGAGPYRLAAGDLNGDGRPDLAVAREKQKVAVLLNNGNGFAPYAQYPALSTLNVEAYISIALGDVDLDGDLDVLHSSNATTSQGTYAIALLKNNGSGVLAPAQAILLGAYTGGAVDMKVAELTGDPWPDLAIAQGYGGWAVVPGSGGGSFGTVQPYIGGEEPFAIGTGDLDGDGDRDVVVTSRDSLEATAHVNDGQGVFPMPPSYSAEYLANALASGDIDLDGDLDLAASWGYAGGGGIVVLRNQGGGVYGAPEKHSAPRDAMRVKLRDLNGDGLPDLLWADDYPPYNFDVRLNLGGGLFGPYVNWPVGTCGNGDVEAFDMDGDGDLDVFLTDYLGCGGGGSSNFVYVSRNKGNGTFDPPYTVTTFLDPEIVGHGDLNGDGKQDLVVTESIGVEVFLGLGNGSFQPGALFSTDWGPKDVAVGDLDGDGKLDLATCNFGSAGETTSVLIGYGDGAFRPPVNYAGSYGGGARGIRASDVDADGDLDLLVANYGSNDVSLYANVGNGTFAPHVRYGAGRTPVDLAIGDFTGDGAQDVAALVSLPPSGLEKAVAIVRGRGFACETNVYCSAKPNSAGGLAKIGWSGFPQVGQVFAVTASGGLPGKSAVMFFSAGGAAATPFLGGTLCLKPPLTRLPVHVLDGFGSTSYPLTVGPSLAGKSLGFQLWHRDPQHPDGTGVGLSDALEVHFCP
jgi:hypothetical protein